MKTPKTLVLTFATGLAVAAGVWLAGPKVQPAAAPSTPLNKAVLPVPFTPLAVTSPVLMTMEATPAGNSPSLSDLKAQWQVARTLDQQKLCAEALATLSTLRRTRKN